MGLTCSPPSLPLCWVMGLLASHKIRCFEKKKKKLPRFKNLAPAPSWTADGSLARPVPCGLLCSHSRVTVQSNLLCCRIPESVGSAYNNSLSRNAF